MRAASEHTFVSFDGTALFYRRWTAAGAALPRAVILLHRGHEHSARLQGVVDGLCLPDYEMFAWDARGHGRSPGERGYAEHFGVLVKDLDAFVRHVLEAYGYAEKDLALVAQSVGAVVAATWLHDFAPDVCCAVLAAPAFRVRLYVPFADTGLRLLLRRNPRAFVNSYANPAWLTHDLARVESYRSDPLITRRIAVNILLGLSAAGRRTVADAAAIHTPVQVLTSGKDRVVRATPQRQFFAGLGASVKEFHEFPGFFHDTLGEQDRHLPLAKAHAFIRRCFDEPPPLPSLLDADRRGHTYDEYRRLVAPAPPLKALGFALLRAALGSVGRLSAGIQLGLESGFDSGSMLDYVYRNQPAGHTPLGRALDAGYLDSLGWRGIRVRKRHLETLLAQAFTHLGRRGMPVRLVDIGAGHGRYVVEALERLNGREYSALLRDYSPLNVQRGRALIASKGLSGYIAFEQGDACDPQSLALIPGDRSVGVVSGLYELFPDNEVIRRSLAGLARVIVPTGYLIYTNQPWHPQLEFIARVLGSHRGGQRWVMRRRAQREMDQLVREAGFRKLDQLIDQWGIFSVCLAQKVG